MHVRVVIKHEVLVFQNQTVRRLDRHGVIERVDLVGQSDVGRERTGDRRIDVVIDHRALVHLRTGRQCTIESIGDQSIAVGVQLRQALEIESRTDGVIGQRRHDDREVRITQHLQRPADAVGDVPQLLAGTVQRTAGDDARRLATLGPEFGHQGTAGIGLNPQPAINVAVGNVDRFVDDVNDIDVVPNAAGDQRPAANDHAVVAVSVQHVVLDQRPRIADRVDPQFAEIGGRIEQPGRSTVVDHFELVERIDVRGDRRGDVIDEHVADHDRLAAADEQCARRVLTAAHATRIGDADRARIQRHAIAVEFDARIGQTKFGLLHLDRIKGRKLTLDAGLTAAAGDDRVVDRTAGTLADKNAAPLSRLDRTDPVTIIGVERAAGPVTDILERCQNHRNAGQTFGIEIGAELSLDSRSVQFHHGARIDRQRRIQTRPQHRIDGYQN